MEYLSVRQFAEKYGISKRSARNYCATGRIEGSKLTHDQTRYIFETNTIGITDVAVPFVQLSQM